MIHEHVTEYIQLYKTGKLKLNKDRVRLIKLLEKFILPKVLTGELYFDEKQIEQCVRFIERWYFELKEFQKFIISFVFLIEKSQNKKFSDKAYYKEFLIMMGRGGGKNGFISALSHYFLTELHDIPKYNISIVANSEEQAKTSFEEVYEKIDEKIDGKPSALSKAFRITLTEIQSRGTRAKLKFKTSNAKTKDGGREGAVIFDEIHEYENARLINTLRRGLGKVHNGRTFYIGTDGYVRGGHLDTLKTVADNILDGEAPDSRMFPFICKLDDEKEVYDIENWQKANPMFELELSDYADTLLSDVKIEFDTFNYDSTARADFMTKRMNLPEEDLDKVVAKYEDIEKAVRPLPLLNNRTAIVGIDYANATDFASVGFLFRIDNDYVWHQHSFARKEVIDKVSFGPDMYQWEKEGLLTIVDEPTIGPELLFEWVSTEMQRLKINVYKIMCDRFRYDLIKHAARTYHLEDKLEPLGYMQSIYAQVSPRIDIIFNNHQVNFGEDRMMLWYTNNVAVRIKKDGNKEYIKKDPIRRKTDGFHAFIHALYRSDEIVQKDIKKDMNWLKKMLGI